MLSFIRPASRVTTRPLGQCRAMSMFTSTPSALSAVRRQLPSATATTAITQPSFTSITQSLGPFAATQQRWKAMGNTYQPNTLKRKRRLGFLARMKSRTGRKIIARRKAKNRWYLTH